jgi:SAM-dependent methyltransferase
MSAELSEQCPLHRLTNREQRTLLVTPFLSGRGLELGAGIQPQALSPGVECFYFDKRTRAELAALFKVEEFAVPPVEPLEMLSNKFPNGADFLIAHHVLEHLSNPIGALVQWFSWLKEDGLLILSLPESGCCLDRERLVPPIEHLLLDYLLDRDDNSFESREHIFSFILGWRENGVRKDMDAVQLTANCFHCAKMERNDLHWHAYNHELTTELIRSALLFSGCRGRFELVAYPNHPDECLRTSLDLLFVVRLEGRGHMLDDLTAEGQRFRSKLAKCRERFDRMLKRFPDINH